MSAPDLEVRPTAACDQQREGSRHGLELAEIDLLAGGVREPDVAGTVVEGRDAAESGVQTQVAAVRRGPEVGMRPPSTVATAPSTSPMSGSRSSSLPLANWPPAT